MRTYNIIDTRPLRRSLRKNQTTAEKCVWKKLRKKQLHGLRFLRQYGIDRYIVDFYCPSKKIVIEIDGDTHADEAQMRYDDERTKHLNALGLHVLRFTNYEVFRELDGVLKKIALEAGVEAENIF